MYKRSKEIKILCIALFMTIGCNCQNKPKEVNRPNAKVTKEFINCYIMKPVANDSKRGWSNTNKPMREVSDIDLYTLLDKQKEEGGIYKIDTVLDCITSFECQKELLINSHCINKLEYPDSTDLQNLYFNSIYSTSVVTKNHVSFLKKYPKNIFGYGNANVYEYSLSGIAVNPHFLHIIVKIKDSNPYEEDYEGFAISSDGIQWKESKSGAISLPIFIKNTRTKSMYIPLIFDENRFIPIGILKIE